MEINSFSLSSTFPLNLTTNYPMIYNQTKPHKDLENYIDAFWVTKGVGNVLQKKDILPDGCVDLILNLGADCQTVIGTMQSGKTYLVGTMTKPQEIFLNKQHKFIGVRFKPAAFSSFFNYAPLNEVANITIEFDAALSPDIHQLGKYAFSYLNKFFLNRVSHQQHHLSSVLYNIQNAKGQVSIDALTKRNFVTARQLERTFRKYIGISPKEYVNIIRFQAAFEKIRHNIELQSLQDIALETGYYDHAHLTNDVKKYTGSPPSRF